MTNALGNTEVSPGPFRIFLKFIFFSSPSKEVFSGATESKLAAAATLPTKSSWMELSWCEDTAHLERRLLTGRFKT